MGLISPFSTPAIRTALAPVNVHHYHSHIQPAQLIRSSFFTDWPCSQSCLFIVSIGIPQPNHSGG